MEHLIRRGVPQRKAHELVGKLVRKALTRSQRLSELSLADFREADPTLDESVYAVLGAENAVRAFVSYGSTGPEQVKHQLDAWRQRLGTTA
jgi:argininosuccinate lyase